MPDAATRPAVDDHSPTLVSTLQAQMDEVNSRADDDADNVAPDPEDSQTNPAPDSDDDDIDGGTDDGVADDDGDDDADDKPVVSDENLPVLPTGVRRAALAANFTNEEIDQYLILKPEEAKAEFGRIHAEWRAENVAFSNVGRKLAGKQRTDAEPADTKTDDPAPTGAVPELDLKALIDKHGQEEFLTDVVGTLNGTIKQINKALERVEVAEQFVGNSETEALRSEITTFMSSDEMKTYKDVYGTDVEFEKQTDTQKENFQGLLTQADWLVKGAAEYGDSLTVHEALARAHSIVSGPHRTQAVRDKIRASLEKRTKTTPPSKQSTTVTNNSDKPASPEELVNRTEARLKKLRAKS